MIHYQHKKIPAQGTMLPNISITSYQLEVVNILMIHNKQQSYLLTKSLTDGLVGQSLLLLALERDSLSRPMYQSITLVFLVIFYKETTPSKNGKTFP